MAEAGTPLRGSLREQLAAVRGEFGGSADLKQRDLVCGPGQWRAAILYLESLVDRKALDDDVIKSLLRADWPGPVPSIPDLHWLGRRVLSSDGVERVQEKGEAVRGLLMGSALLFLDGVDGALALEARGGPTRAVEEPKIEGTVRGTRAGFVEVLSTNLGLLRRTLPTPKLRFEALEVGRDARTPVVLAYLDGKAPAELVAEVRRRLRRIKVAAVLESRVVEEHLAEERWSPLPLLDHTERPDRVAAGLVEGRVAVLTSGTPFVLLAPTTLWHLMQTPEDYYSPPAFTLFSRVMRTIGLAAAVMMSAIYVALTSYNHELLPVTLALSLLSGRERVPFPAAVEAFILELVFEAVREAGLRLPRPAGQAIGIVGTLLLGEAAIRAGVVSPMMVIIVAVAGMASFTIPNYALGQAARVFRFAALLAAGILGVFGLMMVLHLLLTHAVSLQSFGVPYLAPLAPVRRGEAGDALPRFPWPALPSGPLRPRRGVRPPGPEGRT